MRLVSLCPSITETLITLGVAESLVGVTRFCIHPPDVVAHLPKVGGTKDPHIDRIVAAAPDLVFLNEEENRHEDFVALRAAGVAVESSMTRRVSEVPGQLRRVGRLVHREEAATRIAEALEAELVRLASLRRQRARRFRYAYLIWRNPWMAVGADTYVHDLLGLAGGDNLLAEAPSRYPELTLDDLAALDPDVVFLPDEPFPFSEKHRPELEAQLPGVNLELVSGDDLCWHGVRSLRGVRLAQTFAKAR